MDSLSDSFHMPSTVTAPVLQMKKWRYGISTEKPSPQMAALKKIFFPPQYHDSFNNMFPAFPVRPRCPTEKPGLDLQGVWLVLTEGKAELVRLAMEKAHLAGVVQRSQLVYMLIP